MKAMIGFLFFLLLLGGFALVSLKGNQMSGLSAGGATLTGVRWRPTYVGAESIPEDAGMYVQFEVDGSISGHAGCNSFFGSLEKTESGVKVGPLGATRMACEEPKMSLETSFISALQQSTNFDVSGGRMRCLDDNRQLLAEFVASEAPTE
ncbi:MAG: META domain-containing protein [Woeseiaceae bacterium]|nr:META domain-containing protein [Woeseiaceae bacterium]